MSEQVVYLDNAATSHPKPDQVYRAAESYMRASANPGRGAHRLALRSAEAIFEARLSLSAFLGIKHPERLVFTGGCTASLNFALKGVGLARGDLVVTSALEHNSVMRPLYQLEKQAGISVHCLPYARPGVVDLNDLKEAVRDLKPRLCVIAEASNVTGELVDLAAVADLCRHYRVPLLVDAAQSAGFTESNIDSLGITIWCASGHKGLMGLPGVGLLYVSPEVELDPLIAGGTGSGSEELAMPEFYPDHLEAGTIAGPAIVGLAAGVEWLKAKSLQSVRAHERALAQRFLDWAAGVKWLKLYGPESAGARTGTVAFQVEQVGADRLADLLDQEHGIAVRSGLHCAANAHRALGTLGSGLVRASFGSFNSTGEVDRLSDALENLVARNLRLVR